MSIQSTRPSRSLISFLAALIVSLICLGVIIWMAPASHADSSAKDFPNFTIQHTFGAPSIRTGVVIATDVNNDKVDDIVTGADGGAAEVYISKKTGGQTGFEQPVQFGAGADATRSMTVTDINDDKFNDIVVGNYGHQSLIYINSTKSANGYFFKGSVSCKLPQVMLCFGGATDQTISVFVIPGQGGKHKDILAVNQTSTGFVIMRYVYDSNTHKFSNGNPITTTPIKDTVVSAAVDDIIAGNDGPEIALALKIVGNTGQTNGGISIYNINSKSLITPTPIGTDSGEISSIAVAKIDSNGSKDIIVGKRDAASQVYTQTASISSFSSPPTLFGLGDDNTQSIAIANLDGLGGNDIIAGNRNGSVVYLNDGAGKLKIAQSLNLPGTVYGVAVGYFNAQDRYPDIAAVGTERTTVLFNNRPRLFGDTTSSSIAVANINGDGREDLVVGSDGGQGAIYFQQPDNTTPFSTTAHITSNGCKDTRVSCFGAFGDKTTSVTVANVDNISGTDIIVGNNAANGAQSFIYLNNGSNGFDHSAHTACDPNSTVRCLGGAKDHITSVITGYIDTDDIPDIIVGNALNPGSSTIYLSHGATVFSRTINLAFSPNINASNVKVAIDYTNNKRATPMIVASASASDKSSSEIMIYTPDPNKLPADNKANLTCTTPPPTPPVTPSCFTITGDISDIALADVDNSNSPDIIVSRNGAQGLIYIGKPDGAFDTTTPPDCANPTNSPLIHCFGGDTAHTTSLAVNDVNNDGFPDIITGNNGEPSVVYFNRRGYPFLSFDEGMFFAQSVTVDDCKSRRFSFAVRCFGAGTDSISNNITGIATIDLDHSFQLDLIAINQKKQSIIDLEPWVDRFFGAGPATAHSVVAGDIDGDGTLDLVVRNFYGQNSIYKNAGNGNLKLMQPFGIAAGSTTSMAIADMNRDHALDIILGYEGQSAIYLHKADGTFASGSMDCDEPAQKSGTICFGGANADITSLAVADVNPLDETDGVSRTDIIVMSGGQGAIYLNDGNDGYNNGPPDCNSASVHCFGGPAQPGRKVAVADVDGVNGPDIIVFRDGEHSLFSGLFNEGGQSAVYLNNGHGSFDNFPLDCNSANVRCFGGPSDHYTSVALANVDGVNGLDIIAGGNISPTVQSAVYLQSNTITYTHSLTSTVDCNNSLVRCFGAPGDRTQSVAAADMNGDGKIDIIAGNMGQVSNPGQAVSSVQSRVYLRTDILGQGDAKGGFTSGSAASNCTNTTVRCFGSDKDDMVSVIAADMDGVAGNDIAAVNIQGQSRIFLNNGDGLFPALQPAAQVPTLQSVVLADMDGDKTLDMIAADQQGSHVYFNSVQGAQPFTVTSRLNIHTGSNASLAVGDLDGNGILDLVAANGDRDTPNSIVMNITQGQTVAPTQTFGNSPSFDNPPDRQVRSVAIGDLDHDEALDIVVAGDQRQGMVFFNTKSSASSATGKFYSGPVDCGSLPPGVRCFSNTIVPQNTIPYHSSIALADVNGDGALDIVAGNYKAQSMVYLNDGTGSFVNDAVTSTPDTCSGTENLRCFGDPADATVAVAAADMNGDGKIDLVVANESQQSVVYLNKGQGEFETGQIDCNNILAQTRCFGDGSDKINSVAVGDMDGDGALDIVVGNTNTQSWIYLNDGGGHFGATRALSQTLTQIQSLALGDMNRDGALDIVAADDSSLWIAALDRAQQASHLPNNPPTVAAYLPKSPRLPNGLREANFFAVAESIQAPTIDIPFTLFDAEGDPVHEISATYSLDGGGLWQTAVGTPISGAKVITSNLVTKCGQHECLYTYRWQVYDSHFFGQSDNVVFRILAYPAPSTGAGSVSGAYQRPYAAAQTLPFRVRGTQIQVVGQAAGHSNQLFLPLLTGQGGGKGRVAPCSKASSSPCHRLFLPISAGGEIPISAGGEIPREILPIQSTRRAIVYLLPKGQDSHGAPIGGVDRQHAFVTDANGYLQGHAQINDGDRVMAMLPMLDKTNSALYQLYYTSARPRANGLKMNTLNGQGILRLGVSSDNPLLLFDLTVSLEWDASGDKSFLNQLRADLRRVSELEYEWTSGQIALGKISILQNKQGWDNADVRIYASNRVRPNATQGGISKQPTNDPILPNITYSSGQVRIGPNWNRYGDRSGNQGEDWARALAHELGHYLFFLDDNYLGLKNGVLALIPPDPTKQPPCPSPMTDPYRLDFNRFATQAIWQATATCADTLAARATKRWDWATIITFYRWLYGNRAESGPHVLPLDLTEFDPPSVDPSASAPTPIFSLVAAEDGARIFPSPYARAFLFHSYSASLRRYTQLEDLGSPNLDQVFARGAQSGDQVCVYDLSNTEPSGSTSITVPRVGCKTVSLASDQLALGKQAGWAPDIRVTPVNSSTIQVDIDVLSSQTTNNSLVVQFFSANAENGATQITTTHLVNDKAKVRFKGKGNEMRAGYVRVQGQPGYEIVTDYALGGGPVSKTGEGGGSGVGNQVREAPAISSDGQVILFSETSNYTSEQVLNLQIATSIHPPPPIWATLVGQAYWLNAAKIPDLKSGLSISFNYLGREVPDGEEAGLTVYFSNGTTWLPLDSTQRNAAYNIASAPSQGQGLYALMSSINIDLVPDADGFANFPYSVKDTRPVEEALKSIEGHYTYVAEVGGQGRSYDIHDPTHATLKALEFGHGYIVLLTQKHGTVRLRLKGPLGAPSLAGASQRAEPPTATYYGSVTANAGFAPVAGMEVRASVQGTLCGEGRTFMRNGQVLYVITVSGDRPNAAGCGAPGRIVSFQVGQQPMATVDLWLSDRPRRLILSP